MTTHSMPALPGLDGLPPADQAAIADTLGRLLRGFATRDADLLDGVYTHDADWVNAFGSVKKGNREIVDYLRGLFTDANFDAGELVSAPDSHLLKITHDVVTVSTSLKITGQLLLTGDAIPMRDNHSLRVLARQPRGDWQIASEMYSDTRTDQSYLNHS